MKRPRTFIPLLLIIWLVQGQSSASSSSLTASVNLGSTGTVITAPSLNAAKSCKFHPGGGTCPEETPCCLNGYCSDDPRYCSTGCEPMNSWKESSCFPQAFCTNLHEDFNQPRLATSQAFNGNPYEYDFTVDYNPQSVKVEDSILKIDMRLDSVPNSFGRPQGLGSAVSTTRFMQYGRVQARIKMGSSSPGVVSAFIVRNEDPGDEIDFEIVGRNASEAQTNFYFRTPPSMPPDQVDYSNTGRSALDTNTAQDFHNYEIEWMPDYILWKVDDRVIRSVFKNETKDVVGVPGAKQFPQSPARIQFGIWDGGQGSNGTAAWAGTPTDWSKHDQTYQLQVDYVDIQCYYSGNSTLTSWPPAGYGPTKIHSGPYNTPGLNGGYNDQDDNSGGGASVRPFVPFYKNMRLMIPTGCFGGLALIVIATIEVVRRRRLARVRWE